MIIINKLSGIFNINDMQTLLPPPPLLKKTRFYFFVQIVAYCSETNEKSIIQF